MSSTLPYRIAPVQVKYNNLMISDGSSTQTASTGGEGHYDFGARIYDARLGRFLSLDPLMIQYPHNSPFLYANNNPIYFIDSEGKNAEGYIGEDGKLYIQVTYHAISEGSYSYTDIEMQQVESLNNTFYKQAVGMKVTLADGREVEIGGVQFSVVHGGDNSSTIDAVVSTGENGLFKATSEFIKSRSTESAVGISGNYLGGSSTINVTILNEEMFSKMPVGDELKKFENQVVDEGGHIMGTRHPEKKKDETNKEFKSRKTKNFGDIENGYRDHLGRLKLSTQDMQNIINSGEFKLRETSEKNQKDQMVNNESKIQLKKMLLVFFLINAFFICKSQESILILEGYIIKLESHKASELVRSEDFLYFDSIPSIDLDTVTPSSLFEEGGRLINISFYRSYNFERSMWKDYLEFDLDTKKNCFSSINTKGFKYSIYRCIVVFNESEMIFHELTSKRTTSHTYQYLKNLNESYGDSIVSVINPLVVNVW